MARPTKWRKIDNLPTVQYFVPSENRIEEVSENILKLEELEAIRLKDLEGLEQDELYAKTIVKGNSVIRLAADMEDKKFIIILINDSLFVEISHNLNIEKR